MIDSPREVVQELLAASERQRRNAESEGEKLLQLIGLTANDATRLFRLTQQEEDWEPS